MTVTVECQHPNGSWMAATWTSGKLAGAELLTLHAEGLVAGRAHVAIAGIWAGDATLTSAEGAAATLLASVPPGWPSRVTGLPPSTTVPGDATP